MGDSGERGGDRGARASVRDRDRSRGATRAIEADEGLA